MGLGLENQIVGDSFREPYSYRQVSLDFIVKIQNKFLVEHYVKGERGWHGLCRKHDLTVKHFRSNIIISRLAIMYL